MTNKIAILNDTHFGVRGDAPFMLEYQRKFYDEVFFPYLIENGIDEVFHLGDMFDKRKQININTLIETRKMLMDKLEAHNIHMSVLVGNHDTYNKSTNEIESLTPLLHGYDNITVLKEPTTLKRGKLSILMIPWICDENRERVMTAVESSTADILCGHLELVGFEYQKGVTAEHGDSVDPFQKFKKVLSGHYHEKSTKKNIHYLGAQMQFTFADCDCKRGFHVLDTDTGSLKFVENPNTMFVKLYYDDSVDFQQYSTVEPSLVAGKFVKVFVVKKTKPSLFEAWFKNLSSSSPLELVAVENMAQYESSMSEIVLELESELSATTTQKLIEEYVDTTDIQQDKGRVKTLLTSIYTEALHNQTL